MNTFLIPLLGITLHALTWGPHALVVSKNCEKGPSSCVALKNLPQATAELNDMNDGGRNPGVPICRRLKGSVVLGQTPQGDQQSFCRFTDESYISLASLYAETLRRTNLHKNNE